MYKLLKSAGGLTTVPLDTVLLDSRHLFLEGEINSETACRLIKQIMALNFDSQTEPIELFINSPGGEVNAGLAIHDAILLSSAPVHTVCLSEGYSMAALIFSGGRERAMFPNAKLMLHEPLLNRAVSGNVSSIRGLYETMDRCKARLNAIFAENTGKTLEEINDITAHDHYFTAEEAVAFGLADHIVTPDSVKGGMKA